MGEAKRRGTHEDRVKESIERVERLRREAAEERRREQERKDAEFEKLPEEEKNAVMADRNAYKKKKLKLQSLLAAALTAGSMYRRFP